MCMCMRAYARVCVCVFSLEFLLLYNKSNHSMGNRNSEGICQ